VTAAALLQLHLEQALLLSIGWLLIRGAWGAAVRWHTPAPDRWRRLAVAVAGVAVTLPLIVRLLPRPSPLPPGNTRGAAASAPIHAGSLSPVVRRELAAILPQYRLVLSAAAERAAALALLALAAGFVIRARAVRHRHRALRQSLETLPVLRRLGRVTLCASDVATVPYAARAAGRAWVVVPMDLVDDTDALRILLAHELHHHRQHDLQTVAMLEAAHTAFWWLPVMTAWKRLIGELQELACDDATLRRSRTDPRVYGELLLRAAQFEDRWRYLPRGVRAASGPSSGVLKRRIAMLMRRTGERRSGSEIAAGMACLAILSMAAVGARSAVLERKMAAADVDVLAQRLAAKGIVVRPDEIVVEEVESWVSTARGRAFLRESRDRLALHRAAVDAALVRQNVPAALSAVAIVESGFRSLEQKPGFRAAGVWQFIPQTARVMGLRVEPGLDERMDLEKETAAAAVYLGRMYGEFQDWPLALAAYNQGREAVRQASERGQTRDAWALIRAGHLGRYAATVVAAALVLEDADRLLEERP
jgi:membrane-bound lytic murein transglycosylase D